MRHIICAAHRRDALNSRELARHAPREEDGDGDGDDHSRARDDYSVGYMQWLTLVTEAEGVLLRERCRIRPWERGVSSLEELHDVIYGPRPASESGSTSTHSSMPSLPSLVESTHVGQGRVDFDALHSDTFALTRLVRQDLGMMFHADIPDGTRTNTNASTVTTAPSSSDSSIGALASDAVSHDPDDPDVFLDALRRAAADYMIVFEEREEATMVNESMASSEPTSFRDGVHEFDVSAPGLGVTNFMDNYNINIRGNGLNQGLTQDPDFLWC